MVFDKSLECLRNTIASASTDPKAELTLREFIKLASEEAPIEEILKLGEAMIENLKNHRRKYSSNN